MRKGVIGTLSAIIGAAAGIAAAGRRLSGQIEQQQKKADKHMALYLMMNQWVRIKQEGKKLSSYFEREGYREIAIYGMSYAGETLAEELKDSAIKVKYGIDKNTNKIFADFDVVAPDVPLEAVDAVVVTSITFFEEIEELLRGKIDCPIISLDDILYEV